jgi:hypothetical protein
MDSEGTLKGLKRDFYFALLENSVLSRLVAEAMDQTGNPHLLPDFVAEPWRPVPPESNPQVLGLTYLRAGSSTPEQMDEMSLALRLFGHIEVLTIGTERTDATLLTGNGARDKVLYFDGSMTLMKLTDVPRADLRGAAAYFMLQWQTFVKAAATLDAQIDPMMGTFTTESRNYQTFE